jgi:hypothetical protein
MTGQVVRQIQFVGGRKGPTSGMEGAALVESIVAIATVITAGATIAYVLVATGQLKAIR